MRLPSNMRLAQGFIVVSCLNRAPRRTVVRAGVYPDLASRFDFWPVNTAEGQNAVIGLAFDPDDRPSTPDALVDIVRSILALVLDRQHVRVRRDARPAS